MSLGGQALWLRIVTQGRSRLRESLPNAAQSLTLSGFMGPLLSGLRYLNTHSRKVAPSHTPLLRKVEHFLDACNWKTRNKAFEVILNVK
jgi:hypothetical protein